MPAPTLVEFKRYLDTQGVGAGPDSDLQAALDAGVQWVEQRVGPLSVRGYDVTVMGSGGSTVVPVLLPVTVASVTTAAGQSLTVSWFDPKSRLALITQVSRQPLRWQGTNGFATTPEPVRQAALVIAAMTLTQRRGPVGGNTGGQGPRAGIPRAMALMDSYMPAVGPQS